ncbi:unnamed protein product, partial [Mesorhabditis spiculigera]
MNADRAAITDVQNQLNNQFLPAVKSMGAAGAELLRAFQALQRSTDAYCTSLAQLARSAKGASPAAENYGKQLLETSKQFRDTMQHHERSVANFSVFANKTNRFSTGEKDVLKEMASRFAKDEKEFLKTKPSAEASGKFYAKEREYFVKQQELRYKFFFDRHEEWFKTYGDLIEYCQEVANREEEGSRIHASTKTSEATKPEEKPAAPSVLVAVEVNGTQSDRKSTASSKASSASSIEGIRSRLSTQDDQNSIALISEKQLVQTNPTETAPSNEHRLAEIAQENIEYLPQREWPQAERHHESMAYDFRPREASPERARTALQLHPAQNVAQPQPAVARAPPKFGYQVFPPMAAATNPSPLPVYAADPKPTPAARTVPVVVPSPFSAQDYGVSLEVNEDYSPSGPDQLSVVRGDRVTLIKSGNRGWIFIKEASGNRTGWIPAQFASKV